MVMSLTQSPTWNELAPLWRGVQSDLALPAPAIAVAGPNGLQLWFSLAEPIPVPLALAFLDALRARYLPDVEAGRVRCQPCLALHNAAVHMAAAHVLPCGLTPIPASLEAAGRWSAFVAADLVALFDDTPWLDVEPSDDGQATLLRGLVSTEGPAFERACHQLGLRSSPAAARTDARGSSSAVATGLNVPPLPAPAGTTATAPTDPQRFLQQIMQDGSVALALRIEAAKALLQHEAAQGSARHD
jgi:hypothetical protein